MSRPRFGTRYVSKALFIELNRQYTLKAIEKKIEQRVWRFGQVLAKAPDGHVMIDLDGFERWVEGEKVAA